MQTIDQHQLEKLQGNQKPHVNMVVIGHVDSGKSTTCGHLIYQLGGIDQREIDKLAKEAEANNKQSFVWAYVMDKNKQSREQGITINISYLKFFTPNYQYTLIDAPGHRDFIKNMITGTSQADISLLMIAAGKGEFEAGFSKNGQTKEHALLAYTFGVKKIIVCINKMDDQNVNYSEERFNEIKNEVSRYLRKIGYQPQNITFVPISGYHGENLINKSEKMEWYKGPSLVEVLDSIEAPYRPTEKPLRISVTNTHKIQGVGTVIAGKIESGILKPGQIVSFAPDNKFGEVKSIESHREQVQQAIPGDSVGFCVRNIGDKDVKKGYIGGEHKKNPPRVCKSFIAQLMIINVPKIIKEGYIPNFSCHTAQFQGEFTKLIATIDKKTGKTIEENPENIKNGDIALIQITPKKQICVEKFSEYPSLGRIAVRDQKNTIAIGVVKDVIFE